MTVAIEFFFIAQTLMTPAPTDAAAVARSAVLADLPAMNSSTVAAAQRLEFERRYAVLVKAMNDFAEKYNRSKGNVWPLKEAAAVRRAFRDFERLQPEVETDKK